MLAVKATVLISCAYIGCPSNARLIRARRREVSAEKFWAARTYMSRRPQTYDEIDSHSERSAGTGETRARITERVECVGVAAARSIVRFIVVAAAILGGSFGCASEHGRARTAVTRDRSRAAFRCLIFGPSPGTSGGSSGLSFRRLGLAYCNESYDVPRGRCACRPDHAVVRARLPEATTNVDDVGRRRRSSADESRHPTAGSSAASKGHAAHTRAPPSVCRSTVISRLARRLPPIET